MVVGLGIDSQPGGEGGEQAGQSQCLWEGSQVQPSFWMRRAKEGLPPGSLRVERRQSEQA